MIRVLFICYGNICRSTMGQYLLQHLAEERGLKIAASPEAKGNLYIDSAATSRWEIGNPVDRRTVAKLKDHGVACGSHKARQVTRKDYDIFDLILIMDEDNRMDIKRILPSDPEGKIHKMLEYAEGSSYKNPDGSPRDIDDPWYTHDFEKTYQDLLAGCSGLLNDLFPDY